MNNIYGLAEAWSQPAPCNPDAQMLAGEELRKRCIRARRERGAYGELANFCP
jgi:hypothetical protein